tara:strand:+ start:177 stop:305 length:129 start_codon:yes stop_codon:yes gene_type:complete
MYLTYPIGFSIEQAIKLCSKKTDNEKDKRKKIFQKKNQKIKQ